MMVRKKKKKASCDVSDMQYKGLQHAETHLTVTQNIP